jgi:hypothetical protein
MRNGRVSMKAALGQGRGNVQKRARSVENSKTHVGAGAGN